MVWMSIIDNEHRVPGDPRVARGRLGEAAVVHDADVGRRPAHVEGDELAAPGELAAPPPAEDPGGGPESRVTTGRSDTVRTVATPPFELMTWSSAETSASFMRSPIRLM